MNRKTLYSLGLATMSVLFVASAALCASEICASETDDRIVESFKKSYVYKTYLKDDAIKIVSKEGVVTLTGTVSEEGQKTLAQETAANLLGVVRVENQLETKGDIAAEKSDTWIRRKVKFALLFHRHVRFGTTVEVKDGVVTLKGEADSEAQKELTAEYAKDIDGVKAVSNEMTVAETPEPEERTEIQKIDDASITAQVKAALSIHRSTRAVETKVVTREGEVTLTGIAKNDAGRALVTKLVADIRGVTSVNNKMTVKETQTK